MPAKTVASPLVRTIMRAAEAGGMSNEEFVRRTGVTVEEVEDQTARIGRTKYERVLAVMDQLQPPAAPPGDSHGLDWSEANFPVLVAAWLNAPTLRVAVDKFLAYRPILGQFDGVTEREGDRMARVEYVAEGPQKFAPWQAAGNFCVLVHIVRAYDQAGPTRFAAGLVGPPPVARVRAAREELLLGKVEYDQAVNFLEFPRTNLDVPFPRYNPALEGILTPRLDADVRNLMREASFALTVEQALRRALSGSRHGSGSERALERLCEELRMTRWTVRRRLAEEGRTFKGIHATVKLDEARRLLGDASLSLADVSEHLGFNSQSSFTRFFRKEVGVPPLRYRYDQTGS
jgi:AraC-like DNA-binding protein